MGVPAGCSAWLPALFGTAPQVSVPGARGGLGLTLCVKCTRWEDAEAKRGEVGQCTAAQLAAVHKAALPSPAEPIAWAAIDAFTKFPFFPFSLSAPHVHARQSAAAALAGLPPDVVRFEQLARARGPLLARVGHHCSRNNEDQCVNHGRHADGSGQRRRATARHPIA